MGKLEVFRGVAAGFNIAKSAFKKWYEKDPFRESAVIAYYSIFSLPGLFLVILTLAGFFLAGKQ